MSGEAGGFTLVRHSAFAQAADPAFEEAVEVCEVTGRQAYLVRAAGGRLWTERAPAAALADALNVALRGPAGAGRRGYFSSLRIAGADLFIPPDGATAG